MARQLTLIETKPRSWRLDERTKAVGIKGVGEARAALEAATKAAAERAAQRRGRTAA